MKYISSADDFFNQSRLFESIGSEPFDIWGRIGSMTLQQYEPATVQERAAMLTHQEYLLSTFDTVEEIYFCENLLTKNGYNPVFLTLEGAYLETVAAVAGVRDVSEGLFTSIKNFFSDDSNKSKTEDSDRGLWDLVKGFFSTMTEGGSAIGILQFVLDIIGIIPVGELTLGTLPLNQAANILNAIISFYRGNFLIGLISLGMGIPGVGQVIFAPIKLIMKPFTGILGKLGETLWKGEASAARAAASEFKASALAIDPAAKSSTGIITALGNGLKSIATYIGEFGLKIVGGIVDFIGAILNKLSLGIIPKPAGLSKWISELSTKLGAFSKNAAEAGEILLKDEAKAIASAEKAAGKAEGSALTAGETAAEAEKIAKKFANVPGFSSQTVREIVSSPGYARLAGSSESIKNMYLTYATSEKMIGNILAKEGQISGKSLIELLRTPGMVSQLERAGFRGMDKVLVDSIKAGDAAALSNTLKAIIETPGAMKLVSPNVAKTIAIFKEAPEVLINGPKALKSAQEAMAKIAASGGKRAYVGISGRALIALFLKYGVRSSECLTYLGKGDSVSEVFDKFSEAASDKASDLAPAIASSAASSVSESMPDSQRNLSRINEEDDNVEEIIKAGKAELDKIKSENSEAFDEVQNQIKSTESAIAELADKVKPANPCSIEAAASEALTGATVGKANKIVSQTGLYKEVGGGEMTLVDTEEEYNAMIKPVESVLDRLGEDSDLKPQHSLTATDPYSKAFFSDVWDFSSDTLSPNLSGESRLDKTLDILEKNGDLNPSMRDEVKAETLKHWKDGTIPSELQEESAGRVEEGLQTNRFTFKVGKLTTRR